MPSTNLQTGQPADPMGSNAPEQSTLSESANENQRDDTCWTCGLHRQGAGAAHDCIQSLKQQNKDLREMLIALLSRKAL